MPTALGLITFIAWLVRLEAKQARNGELIENMDDEVTGLWKQMDRHEKNMGIHFNEKVSKLVDEKNAARFKEIEKQLEKIDAKLDRLAAK